LFEAFIPKNNNNKTFTLTSASNKQTKKLLASLAPAEAEVEAVAKADKKDEVCL
jgi:hypothetical protein